MWCIGENLPYDSLRDGTAPSGRSGPCSPAAGVSQASGSTCNYMRQPPETSLGVQRFFFYLWATEATCRQERPCATRRSLIGTRPCSQPLVSWPAS